MEEHETPSATAAWRESCKKAIIPEVHIAWMLKTLCNFNVEFRCVCVCVVLVLCECVWGGVYKTQNVFMYQLWSRWDFRCPYQMLS